MQSTSRTQFVLQEVPSRHTKLPEQPRFPVDRAQAVSPVPVPLQFLGWKVGEVHWPLPWLPLVHWPAPQLVDALAGAHLPPAAHAPVMQVPEQAPSDVPAGLPVQVPRLPEILHAWQAGQDEDEQHTLSVQVKPAPHWEVVEHEAPLVPRAAQSFPPELQPFAQVIVAAVEHTPSSLHK